MMKQNCNTEERSLPGRGVTQQAGRDILNPGHSVLMEAML